MSDQPLSPELQRLVDRFDALNREQTMEMLVEYAKAFPELPQRYQGLADEEEFRVHECMTPVSLFSEVDEGKIYYYADVPESAPTVRALLTIFTGALNGSSPEEILAVPADFVTRLMRKVGLSTRERGLHAMVLRMKRDAVEALST